MQCRWRYAPFGETASLLPIQPILPQQPFGVAVGLLAALGARGLLPQSLSYLVITPADSSMEDLDYRR
jgi:hypothetical protein